MRIEGEENCTATQGYGYIKEYVAAGNKKTGFQIVTGPRRRVHSQS